MGLFQTMFVYCDDKNNIWNTHMTSGSVGNVCVFWDWMLFQTDSV